MTDRATLLAHCLAQPADDTARLVYADHLRESDTPAVRQLGRFVWAGVTLSRFRGTEPVTDGMFFDAARDLEETGPRALAAQLKAVLGWEWERVAWDQDAYKPDRLTAAHMPDWVGGKSLLPRHTVGPRAVYERGMLCGLRLTFAEWRRVGAAVLAVCPLERIEVLDVPGLVLTIAGPDAPGWRLAGDLELPSRNAALVAGVAGRPTQPTRLTAISPTAAERPDGLSREELCGDARLLPALSLSVALDLQRRAGDRWPGPEELLGGEIEGQQI